MNVALQLFKFLWIYSYLTLSLVAGVALLPSYFLVRTVWSWDVLFGVVLDGPDARWGGELLRGLLVTTSGALAFFLFGLSLILVVFLMRILMGLRSKEGEIPIPSLGLWTWYHYDGLLLFTGNVFGPFLRGMSLFNVYLRLMGAKVGRNVILNSHKIYDHDLLSIGDNTIVGGDVTIIAHVAEHRRLIRRRVTIGRNVTIGLGTTIFPGAQIGDNVIIAAHSLVLKGQIIPSDSVWGGAPARELRRAA